jgi:hypothetical protein
MRLIRYFDFEKHFASKTKKSEILNDIQYTEVHRENVECYDSESVKLHYADEF